jgi:hypothetical protein
MLPQNSEKKNSADHEAGQQKELATVLHSCESKIASTRQVDFVSSSIAASPQSSFDHKPSADISHQKRKFSKEGPVLIELFAGSGRFTAALKANGVHSAFGVDHKKLSSIAPIMIADLTTRAGQSLFMTWLDAPNLAGIFAAPPCGTCSLARNIKVRGPKGNIISGPIPLRSPTYPEGFPNLTHTNLKRVLAANKLYDFLAKVVEKANRFDCCH